MSVPHRHCGWLVLGYLNGLSSISLANLVKTLEVHDFFFFSLLDVVFHGGPQAWPGVLNRVHSHLHHPQKLLFLVLHHWEELQVEENFPQS